MPSLTKDFKVLGQLYESTNTLTDVYTVPAGYQAVISSIIVSPNPGLGNVSITITIAKAGAADSLEQYIYPQVVVVDLEPLKITAGITLDETDVVRFACHSAGGAMINIFGVERLKA